jgi:hypothetical protein
MVLSPNVVGSAASSLEQTTGLRFASNWNPGGSFGDSRNSSFYTEVVGCQYVPPPPNNCPPNTEGCPPCIPGTEGCPPWHPRIPTTPRDTGFLCTPIRDFFSNPPDEIRNNQNDNHHTNFKFGGQTSANNNAPLNLSTLNWESDSLFSFFRNNQDNHFRIDVWSPAGSFGLGGYSITYPSSFTSIVFDPDGTPEPDSTRDTFFRFFPADNQGNELTNVDILNNNTPSRWNGIGGENGNLLSPSEHNKHGYRLIGELNSFLTRASWASDSDAPHKFNMLWLNEARIASWSPDSVRTSSGSGGTDADAAAVLGNGPSGYFIEIDLVCPATMNDLQHQTPIIFRASANPDSQDCADGAIGNARCREHFLTELEYTDGYEFCLNDRSRNEFNCQSGHWVGTRKIQINFVRAIGE